MLAANTAVVILLLSSGLSSGEAFSLILNITGGIGGALLTFILPCAMYVRCHEKSDRFYCISYTIIVLAFIFMLLVMAGIVADEIDPVNMDDDEP